MPHRRPRDDHHATHLFHDPYISPGAYGFEVANGPSEVCAGPALGAGVRTCSGSRVACVTDCGSSASLQPQPVTGATRFGLAEDETAVLHSSPSEVLLHGHSITTLDTSARREAVAARLRPICALTIGAAPAGYRAATPLRKSAIVFVACAGLALPSAVNPVGPWPRVRRMSLTAYSSKAVEPSRGTIFDP
jgi:hypothetical protein